MDDLGHQIETSVLTGWQERRILIRDFKKEVTKHINLSIGFSLFWTWVWLIFQTTYLSPKFFSELSIALPPWVLPLAAYALTFSVLGFLMKAKRYVPHSKVYHGAIPLTMSLSLGICAILYYYPLDSAWLNVVCIAAAAIMLGCATACFHVEWGRMLGELGPRKTMIHGIIGTVLAAIILILITSLPLGVLWLCAISIPPLSAGLLFIETRKHPRLYLHGLETKPSIPWKFLITSFLQGLSFGIAQVILLLGSHESPSVLISATAFAFSAIILLACAFFFKMDFNQLIYQIGFVIASFGYVLFAVIGIDNPLSLLTHGTGYRFIDIMMWALCTYLVKQRGLSANWVFAWTTCALLVGQVCGALLGNALFFSIGFYSDSTLVLSVVMVFVLLAGSLLLSNRKNLQTGWGMVRPGQNDPYGDNFEMGCKLVCREYGLTAREEEIFHLLAEGKNRNAMCDTLTLSKETIKTHIRNIYKKIGIHSQQEAFFLVEKTQKEFGFDEEIEHSMRL